jgi:predicted aspartyl protease
MTKIIGQFVDFNPVVRAGISRNGELIIGRGESLIVIDSGFTGDICAPREILEDLDVQYSGTMPFQLADGSVVWKDLWMGKIALGNNKYEVLFIEGDFLFGMELASNIFSYFLIDFVSNRIEIELKRVRLIMK